MNIYKLVFSVNGKRTEQIIKDGLATDAVKNKKIKRIVALSFIVFIYKCPIYVLFHIPCPGCGLTRANLAALRLDFKSAFMYHPLFFFIPILVLYIVHRNKLKQKINPKIEVFILISICLAFVIVYVIRLINNSFK